MSRPFCSDCVSYYPHGDAAGDVCKHPASLENEHSTNYIRRADKVFALRCVTMRLVGGKCGLEGKLFMAAKLV